jgi:uncharacterized repeat protein (TIGR01451 family)
MPAKSHVSRMNMLRSGLHLAGCVLLLAGAAYAQDKPPKSPLAPDQARHAMRAPTQTKTSAPPAGMNQPFVLGQIFASIGTGQVAVLNPDGTLVQTLTITGFPNGVTAGSTFDTNGNFYVTDFTDEMVFEFDSNGNFVGPFGSGYNLDPESIGQAINGNFFVGQADGTRDILEFDNKGNLLMAFAVATENRGTDWSDLQADQKTILYTSEGMRVLSFDISTNTQNPDFAQGMPGPSAYAHRTLPNGDVLVADSNNVLLLNTSGTIIQTYTPVESFGILFALNLDPDGKHFWTADILSGLIFEFDIATGVEVNHFTVTLQPGGELAGLAIFGETKPGTADLSIVKTGAPNPVNVGSQLVYTLTVGNAGPLDGTNVTVSDTLPAGVTFVVDNPSQGSCSGTTTISCNLGTVKSGAQATVLIGVTPTAPGMVTNTATVTGDQPDPNLTNNTSSTTTTVNQGTTSLLMVTLAGNGSGSVTSNPPGINCPETACSFNFPNGTVVMLSEMTNNGSTFAGWSMDCTGTGACSVTMDQNHSVTATFNQNGTSLLMVTLAGSGSGTVMSNPSGINCPETCSFNFPNGTVVMLSEMAGNNSTFGGWSMDCSGTGACSVTMNANHSVTATFNSNSGNTFNFTPLPGSGTTATVVPGQGATFPLSISSNGFNGVVNLTCSISGPPSITCAILPSSVTLTNGTTTATISVKTFCSGAPPAGPFWRLPGVGWLYLAGAALFCGLAFAGRRRRGLRLAWSSGILALVLMCAGCPSIPSGPNGRTAPGTYHLTIFATAQGQQVPGGQIQLTLIVK